MLILSSRREECAQFSPLVNSIQGTIQVQISEEGSTPPKKPSNLRDINFLLH